jgi:hypothetical protein
LNNILEEAGNEYKMRNPVAGQSRPNWLFPASWKNWRYCKQNSRLENNIIPM